MAAVTPHESSPRLRRTSHVQFSQRSSNASLYARSSDGLPGPHDDLSEDDDHPSLIHTADPNRSVAPHTVPLPAVTPEPRLQPSCETLSVIAPALPASEAGERSPPGSPNLHVADATTAAPPVLSFRPDPLAERAATAAEKCYDTASSMFQRLTPCEPLLPVAESAESCYRLMGILPPISASLRLPPPEVQHDCAPLGLCPHEGWHRKHAEKMRDLTRILDQFLAEFDSNHARPHATAELTAKLVLYIDRLQRFPARIQRSWIRLQVDINEAKMQNCVRAARAAERDLAVYRRNCNELRRQHDALVERFNASAGHP
ncbi:hypothetical protein MVEN_00595800 [Mycena venus]|uniref:Uncharacterized protein n=1 Tax=Mycena venus TaxID=2733690 RepID=A0A8H6YQG5_9AGAR|nr:hypothetical protein MVEN_00595800 [Mycena venus]